MLSDVTCRVNGHAYAETLGTCSVKEKGESLKESWAVAQAWLLKRQLGYVRTEQRVNGGCAGGARGAVHGGLGRGCAWGLMDWLRQELQAAGGHVE